MKKNVLILILLLLPALLFAKESGNSDNRTLPAVEFSIKGALSLPSFFWLEDLSWNSVTMFALQGGAWGCAAFNITEDIAVQAEAGYCGKGASLDASDGYLRWSFHYIEVPVWVKWSVRMPDSSLWLGAGGYYGYLLGGSYDFSVPGSEWNGTGQMTVGSSEVITEIRQHDAGLLFVFGGSSGNIEFELKFPVGLVPVLAFTPADQYTYGGLRKALNSGIMLCIAYRF